MIASCPEMCDITVKNCIQDSAPQEEEKVGMVFTHVIFPNTWPFTNQVLAHTDFLKKQHLERSI